MYIMLLCFICVTSDFMYCFNNSYMLLSSDCGYNGISFCLSLFSSWPIISYTVCEVVIVGLNTILKILTTIYNVMYEYHIFIKKTFTTCSTRFKRKFSTENFSHHKVCLDEMSLQNLIYRCNLENVFQALWTRSSQKIIVMASVV